MNNPIYEAYIRRDGHITNPDETIMFIDDKFVRVKRISTIDSQGVMSAHAARYLQGYKIFKSPETGFIYQIESAADQMCTQGEQIKSLLQDDEYVLGPDFITSRTPSAMLYDYVVKPNESFDIYKIPKYLVGKTITLKSGTFKDFQVRVTAVNAEKVYFEVTIFGKLQKTYLPVRDFILGLEPERVQVRESNTTEDGVDRVNVCSDCEREYGALQLKPNQTKTNGWCRRHYIKMLQTFAKTVQNQKAGEEVALKINAAKNAPDERFARDLSTRLLNEEKNTPINEGVLKESPRARILRTFNRLIIDLRARKGTNADIIAEANGYKAVYTDHGDHWYTGPGLRYLKGQPVRLNVNEVFVPGKLDEVSFMIDHLPSFRRIENSIARDLMSSIASDMTGKPEEQYKKEAEEMLPNPQQETISLLDKISEPQLSFALKAKLHELKRHIPRKKEDIANYEKWISECSDPVKVKDMIESLAWHRKELAKYEAQIAAVKAKAKAF